MLAFLWGWGILGYLIAWIVMPQEPLPQAAPLATTSDLSQPAGIR
jgi:hypothetical protein